MAMEEPQERIGLRSFDEMMKECGGDGKYQ